MAQAVADLEEAEPDFAQQFALSTPQQLKKRYSDGELANHCDLFSELKPTIDAIFVHIGELVTMKETREETKRKAAAAAAVTPSPGVAKRRRH